MKLTVTLTLTDTSSQKLLFIYFPLYQQSVLKDVTLVMEPALHPTHAGVIPDGLVVLA